MRDYSKFYTPKELAEFLIYLCGNINPTNIIDICAGTWNLLNCAKKTWPNAVIDAVDVSPQNSNTVNGDGRIYSYEAYNQNLEYDLVLANPPFQFEKPSKEIFRIINKVIDQKFSGYVLSRLESTMMLFNSLLLKEEGILAAIVPTGIINTEKQLPLRNYLANNFHIKKIVRLPDNAFGATGINTSILIIEKSINRESTKVYSAVKTNGIYKETLLYKIPLREIQLGNWEVNFQNKEDQEINLINVYRNKIATQDMKGKVEKGGIPVIHSSNISKDHYYIQNKLSYVEVMPDRANLTIPGDIVITRVGRLCGTFAVITEKEKGFLTSDCVLIIRAEKIVDKERLLKNLILTDLNKIKKGVAARYITKTDIIDLLG